MFKKLFKKFLGFEEEIDDIDDYEEFENDEEIEEVEEINEKEFTEDIKPKSEITLFPKTFADACEIVEQLENGNIVTVNMEDVDIDTCKRISDFILGAIYVLEGDVEKLSKKVFRFWTIK